MHSKCFVATLLIVSILVTGSCSFLSFSGGKTDFIYGEGTSPLSRNVELAKAIAAGNSQTAIMKEVIGRCNRYYEIFKIQSGLQNDSKAVMQFGSILKGFSPKPGTIDIAIKDIEKIEEDVEEKTNSFRVTVVSRIHIGSADKTLLEKIDEQDELSGQFKKTKLYV